MRIRLAWLTSAPLADQHAGQCSITISLPHLLPWLHGRNATAEEGAGRSADWFVPPLLIHPGSDRVIAHGLGIFPLVFRTVGAETGVDRMVDGAKDEKPSGLASVR